MKRKVFIFIVLIVFLVTTFNVTNTYASFIEDVISGGKDFVDKGSSGNVKKEQLVAASNDIQQGLLILSFFIVAIVGISLGIKFMMSGVEEKAEVKKSLVVFVIGCIVIYGAYGIWSVIVKFLNTL